MDSKVSKEYWEHHYEIIKPENAYKSDTIRLWIEQHISPVSKNENKTCIEIGCYPGPHLSIFGDLGYELYGIDYCKQLDLLPESLKNAGYRVGKFWKEDFFRFVPQKKFDVVASFGFIEHFTNFIDVLEKHISLVDSKGYLVLEVPNFIGGFQKWFHSNFDKLNYDCHYIPAMDIEKWIDVLNKENYKIIYKGYFGRFDFWTEYERRSLLTRFFLKVSSKIIRPCLRGALPKDKRLYSPFGGIIAQKL